MPQGLGHDARLLPYFAQSGLDRTLARLDMSFGQIPAVAAAYHQQPALLVSDDAAGSLDDEQLREQMRERCVGVGRNDGDEFVRLDFLTIFALAIRQSSVGSTA